VTPSEGQLRTLLFVSTATDMWGAEHSLLALAGELPRLGWGPKLLAPPSALTRRWVETFGGSSVIPMPPGGGMMMRAFRALQAQDAEFANIIVFSLAAAPLALLWKISHSSRRARWILDLHDYLPTVTGRWKLSVVALGFNRVMAISEFAAGQLSRPLRRRVQVLNRPVPQVKTSAAPRAAISHDSTPVRVGIVGRLDPDKEIELVAQAVARHRDMVLVVRGTSFQSGAAYGETLISAAKALLAERLIYEGRVPQTETMDGIDVLVVANRAEAMGRTILEAQASGIPVVVPDAGGAKELVAPGTTGRWFHAGSVNSLSDTLREVRDDWQASLRMAEAARNRLRAPELNARGYAHAYVHGMTS
jgi:glycosyltransferase involved in cell wall biosynthesis